MKICDFLAPGDVIEDLDAGATVPEILGKLARPVAATTGIPIETLVAPLVARERLGATAVGDGVAFPHGKIPGLNELRAAFGRSRKGGAFGASEGLTHFFFALFVPESRPGIQLHALAKIAGLMKSSTMRTALLNAEGAPELYQLLVSDDASAGGGHEAD